MAKQLVNPLERHLEKAVLGVTAIVLIYVVVIYVVASPNQLDLGGETVSPGTIDRALSNTAESVRERIRNVRAETEIPEPLYGALVEGLDPYAPASLPLTERTAVPFSPTVPIVDPTEAGAGRVDLATLVPIAPPRTVAGRSTFLVETADDDPRPIVANWVTVASVFDVQAQTESLRKQYGALHKDVVFGPPRLQRRARRADGGWSDEDWTDVTGLAAPPPRLPEQPRITFLTDGDNLIVPKRDQSSVEDFLIALNDPFLQLDILRPMLPPTINGTAWTLPIFTKRRDILMQDDYYRFRNEAPAKNPEDRYGAGDDLRVEVEVEKTNAEILAEIPARLQDAMKNRDANAARLAYNQAFDIKHDPTAGPSEKAQATDLMQRAEDYVADIKRLTRTTRDIELDVEEDTVREPPPTQTFWIHDARPDSIESGRAYQFRIRPVIFNQLVGHPERFREPTQAGEFFIEGDWSDPVEVSIPPDNWFFITSEDDRNKEVGVEFFRWFEGIWVKAPRRGKFATGDSLELKVRTEVPGEAPGETERPTVHYSAGARIIDIDFERQHRERRSVKGSKGVKFGSVSTACCVVMADSDGRLYERFVALDKNDPRKKQVSDKVWKPQRGDQ